MNEKEIANQNGCIVLPDGTKRKVKKDQPVFNTYQINQISMEFNLQADTATLLITLCPLIENVLVGRAIGDLDRAIDGLNAQNIGLIYDRMIYGQFNDNNHTLKLEEHRVMFKDDRDKINKMDNKNQQQALKEFVTGRKENQI